MKAKPILAKHLCDNTFKKREKNTAGIKE